jgi:NAD(P)-dependent dehydrogenase (short-subunit alcohol dehydrogenase family)
MWRTERDVMVGGILQDRVVIVTGAGRGIGREHALEFGRHGAKVVVNDIGAELDGSGSSNGPAGEVVELIRASGGDAIADGADVADFDQARQLVESTVQHFGRLDVLVNNAGILRDRMIFNMSFEEWESVLRVHLHGTFSTLRHAAAYWREQAKSGHAVDARVINTTSPSGLYCKPGQSNYGAAKAGIAALTVIASRELERYGVCVNAIAPTALTRMTEDIPGAWREPSAPGFDGVAPDNIAPLVVWLASQAAAGITGRVFNVRGGRISVAEGWRALPGVDKGARWDLTELDRVVPALVAAAPPNAVQDGSIPERT